MEDRKKSLEPRAREDGGLTQGPGRTVKRNRILATVKARDQSFEVVENILSPKGTLKGS